MKLIYNMVRIIGVGFLLAALSACGGSKGHSGANAGHQVSVQLHNDDLA